MRVDEVLSYDDHWHRTKGKCGAPGYIAPEVIRDDHYSYKVDSFSVGVMFYELVFGRVSGLHRVLKAYTDSAISFRSVAGTARAARTAHCTDARTSLAGSASVIQRHAD